MIRERLLNKRQPPGRGAAAGGLDISAARVFIQPHFSTNLPKINTQFRPDPLTLAEWLELEATRLTTLAGLFRVEAALAALESAT